MPERVQSGIYTHKTGGGEWHVTERTATHTETLQEGVVAHVSGNNWFIPLTTFERDFKPFVSTPEGEPRTETGASK